MASTTTVARVAELAGVTVAVARTVAPPTPVISPPVVCATIASFAVVAVPRSAGCCSTRVEVVAAGTFPSRSVGATTSP